MQGGDEKSGPGDRRTRGNTATKSAGSTPDGPLRLLVDEATGYAVFMLSPEGLVMTWNLGAEQLEGYVAAEVVGRNFSLFYAAEAVEAGQPAYDLEVAAAAGQYEEQGWRIRKDGSRFWACVTIAALRDDQGVLRGFGTVICDLTERISAGETVARLHVDQQGVFETLAEGVILYSVGPGQVTHLELATTAACTLLGTDETTLRRMSSCPGEDWGDEEGVSICDVDGRPLPRKDLPSAVTARTGASVHDFVWGWSNGGTTRWLSSNSRPMVDEAGTTTGVVFSMVDVTERHNAQRALTAAHARFSALVEHSSDVICILGADAVVLYASPAYRAVYGEDPADRLGRPLTDRIHVEDRHGLESVLNRLVGRSNDVLSVDCRIVRADGGIRHLEVTATNHLADAAVGGIVTNSRDVTDRVETTTRLAHQAMHDTLTGLANRALLLDRVTQALARAQRTKTRCALLFIDLDHFKRINDSLGHAAGDSVLVTVANRLVAALRPGDTIARLGGDEFVLVTEGVEADSACIIASRVRQAVKEPVVIYGQAITIDCSVGITLSGSSRSEALLQQADSALYRAKAHGRGRWEMYDQAMRLDAQRRLDTEAMINRALDHDGVVVHYQPIVSLPSGRVVGSEALARIVAANRDGLVPPDEFIPVAEESGLIIPLGLQMLRRACDQQAKWAAGTDSAARPVWVSVNLSACQLRSPDLVDDVQRIVSASGLPGSALCLELTESTLMESDSSARGSLQELRDLGIGIALDDFGTGMSSLAHLRQFPVNILKIDRSFVAGLGTNQGDTEVAKSIVGLGRALGLGVIAEGVETKLQAHMLSDLGCPEAQGYLFGRPTPADLIQ